MKRILFLLAAIFAVVFAEGQGFERVNTEIGNIGLSITNVGTIGRPNVRTDPQGPPSMEYPLGSGIEHLFEGGIWIGAQVNGQVRVSTAAVDAATGYSTGGNGFEFTALSGIQQRSTLPNSPFFTGSAVSHQDFVTNFTDSNVIVPGTNIPISGHDNPLRAVVRMESYAWNYSFADYFVILNYTITNNSVQTWNDVYLGMWTDLIVRNVNVTQDAGTAFFNKGGNGYLDTLFAVYTFQVSGDDVDYTSSYGSSQFLGILWRNQYFHPNNAQKITAMGYPAPVVNPNFWNFRDFSGAELGSPGDDLERYFKLSNPLPNVSTRNDLRQASNRAQMISAGAIPEILPGETVNFTMAMVTAKQLPSSDPNTKDTGPARRQLAEHLTWSRRTYLGEDINENGELDPGEDLNGNNKLDRFILPEPPATPHVKVVPQSGFTDIYWSNNSVFSIDPISKKQDFEGFRLYKSKLGADLQLTGQQNVQLIAQWDSAGNRIGYNNGFSAIELPQPVYFEGDTTAYHFRYRVGEIINGWQYIFILTAFDEGDEELGLEPLESSFTENTFRVFPGTPPNAFDGNEKEVGVYPNPYRTTAAWDGPSSRTRKIYFYNLPARCRITIYTLAGDIVETLEHSESYRGEDIQWFRNYGGRGNRVFAGGEHAWDLLSKNGQLVTHGLYLFSVLDHQTGEVRQGRFAILK